MKSFVAILTALHVLAHGVFGCCNHGAAIAAQHAEPCVCHHGHDHAEDSATINDCHTVDQQFPARAPHECVHASCHWIVGSAGPGITPLDFYVPAIFCAVVPTSISAQHAAEFQPDDVRGRTSAPRLRLHLAFGVIVV